MRHQVSSLIMFTTLVILFSMVFVIPSNQSVGIHGEKNSVFFIRSDVCSSSQHDSNSLIVSPRNSAPVFVVPGDSFTVSLNITCFDTVYVVLDTAFEPIVDEYWLDVFQVKKTSCSQWDITCIVPVDTYPELYNLSVIVKREETLYCLHQPRSVSVIDSFSQNFSFIHLTDLHVGDPRGFLVDIRETIRYRSIQKVISEINLLSPDFVVISGDLVFGQGYPFSYWREYRKCYELLQMFDVPTFLVPGNHDGYRRFGIDGLTIWQRYFGALYYSFDYGDTHFIAINSYDMPAYLRWSVLFLPLNWGGSISDTQLSWIQEDLMKNQDKMLMMFMHHNPLWETKQDSLMQKPYENRYELLSLIDEYNVSLVLAGHVHRDTVIGQNDTLFVTTTTPSSMVQLRANEYWGYRLITVENGSVSSVNYREPKYSIPSYHVNYFWNSSYEVHVENNLACSISCLLRFFVPHGEYTVNQGTIDMMRQDDFNKQIYVRVKLPAHSYTSILLTQE